MRVLHSSDLHGNYKALIESHATTDFDVWLDTGDFLPNRGRGRTGRIEPDVERGHQIRWLGWKNLPHRLATWLRGRPALVMPGNHDFVDLAGPLRRAGADVRFVTTAGVDLLGMRWAGYREIPRIDDEWMGEEVDFTRVLNETWAADPDVLVTHGPPGGILDEEEGYGCPALTTALTYRPHRVRFHFFGHTHVCGGQEVEEMGIRFYNGACMARVHDLDASSRL